MYIFNILKKTNGQEILQCAVWLEFLNSFELIRRIEFLVLNNVLFLYSESLLAI